MSDEWGPWIEHDGNGCPVPIGEIVQALWRCDFDGDKYKAGQEGTTEAIVTASVARHPAWVWSNLGKHMTHPSSGRSGRMDGKFIRYRIRKPKGLTILENLIADIPQPARPKVDA